MRKILANKRVATMSLAAVVIAIGLAGCRQSIDMMSEAPDAPDAVTMTSFANTGCPIMGGSQLDPTLTTEYLGMTIAFCCDGCPEDWEALSADQKAEKFAAVSQTVSSDDGISRHAHEDDSQAGHDHAGHSI